MRDILIIDDDNGFCEVASLVLEDTGYRVKSVSCPEEAYAILLAGKRFDIILCDLFMPFTNTERQKYYRFSIDVGYKTAKELAHTLPECKVVVLSSLPPLDVMRLSKHLHPIQAFSKPSTINDLLTLIDDASVVQ